MSDSTGMKMTDQKLEISQEQIAEADSNRLCDLAALLGHTSGEDRLAMFVQIVEHDQVVAGVVNKIAKALWTLRDEDLVEAFDVLKHSEFMSANVLQEVAKIGSRFRGQDRLDLVDYILASEFKNEQMLHSIINQVHPDTCEAENQIPIFKMIIDTLGEDDDSIFADIASEARNLEFEKTVEVIELINANAAAKGFPSAELLDFAENQRRLAEKSTTPNIRTLQRRGITPLNVAMVHRGENKKVQTKNPFDKKDKVSDETETTGKNPKKKKPTDPNIARLREEKRAAKKALEVANGLYDELDQLSLHLNVPLEELLNRIFREFATQQKTSKPDLTVKTDVHLGKKILIGAERHLAAIRFLRKPGMNVLDENLRRIPQDTRVKRRTSASVPSEIPSLKI